MSTLALKQTYILEKFTLQKTLLESPVLWLANSTRDDKVVGSNLISSKIIDENKNKIKAMPGSIPTPNSGLFVKYR